MSRRYPNDIPQQLIEEALVEIDRVFTTTWLTAPTQDHRLRKLWQRKDVLSTIELYSFGHALTVMNKINAQWVKGQVKIIKDKDDNNRRGAFFEIIGLSQLADSTSYKVIPAPHSQAGFDATIQFSGLPETRLSLKSYGRSIHDRKFEEYGTQLESTLLSLMKKVGLHYAEFIIIYMRDKSPQAEDWEYLQSEMPHLIRRFKRANNRKNGAHFIPLVISFQGWEIRIRQSSRINTVDPRMISYSLLVFAPHHFNECRNLYNKLDAAQANFTKHVKDNSTTNIIFIHVPLTISVNQCEKWTQQYFEDNREATSQMVIFYQCALAHDINEATNTLVHTFYPVQNPSQSIPKQVFHFTAPVGRVSLESTQIQLVIDGVPIPEFSLDSSYMFQRGRYYNKAIKVENGSIEGEINLLAPGIHQASVIELQGQLLVCNGNYEPTDELLIL
ncbi:hypothetical protein [Paenibacillus sp. FSL L8-0709]|uniref:hypothetical protein n=1 Tax=Paenibacillus sp. FSL L8-0709 TaxID=2975312 RepID=UPI0030FA6EE5